MAVNKIAPIAVSGSKDGQESGLRSGYRGMSAKLFANQHQGDQGRFITMAIDEPAARIASARDDDPFRQALAAFLPRLRRAAYSKAKYFVNPGETAEDAVQDTCLRALAKAHQCRGDNVLAWLLTILDTRLFDEKKARRRNPLAHPDEVERLAEQADPQTGGAQDVMMHRSQLMLLRQHVTEPHWRTVMLVCMLGYSYREAANILEVPIGTVMSRLHKVRCVAEEKLS